MDRTQKAHVIADTLCRRIYGVPLKRSGGKLPELLEDAFAVLDALAKAEAKAERAENRRLLRNAFKKS